MSYSLCFDNNSCNQTGYMNWIFQGIPWLGDGLYEVVAGDGDYSGENILLYNSSFYDVAGYWLPFGNGYYIEGGCDWGCNDPSSPTYHQSGCDPCAYYDCAGLFYYPAYGETCNGSSQDNFSVCCGGCYDSAACGSTGSGCDYGSGSANCGCNVQDLGCGCGSGWNGNLPADNQVSYGVQFNAGEVYHYGTLQLGVPKSKVILSATLGIPIM